MPAFTAAMIPFWTAAATAGTAATAQTLAARSQNRGMQRAADTQTQGANYAADRQLEATREAERFQRQQAQALWAQQEADRRANYDQWVARERRLGSIAERLGYGGREIPGYVPSTNPNFAYLAQEGTPQHAQWYRDTQMGPMSGGPMGTAMPQPTYSYTPVNGSGRPTGPVSVGYGQTPQAMSARDVLMARRFPEGSVGAMVLARQRRPAGAGV